MNTVDLEAKFAEQIKQRLSQTIRNIIDAGKTLAEAQVQLTAAWGDKTDKWKAFLKSKCHISSSYANKYMTISRHPVIPDSAYWPQLPTGVEVLYQLAILFPEPEQFKERLKSGAINIHLTVEKAIALRPSKTQESKPVEVSTITSPESEKTARAEQIHLQQEYVAPGNMTKLRASKGTPSWKSEAPQQEFYLVVTVPLTDDTASESEQKSWRDFVHYVHDASEQYNFASVRFDGYPSTSLEEYSNREEAKAA